MQQELRAASLKLTEFEERAREAESRARQADLRASELDALVEEHASARERAEAESAAKAARLQELRAALKDAADGEALAAQQEEFGRKIESLEREMESRQAEADEAMDFMMGRLISAERDAAVLADVWDAFREAALQAQAAVEDTADAVSAVLTEGPGSDVLGVAEAARRDLAERMHLLLTAGAPPQGESSVMDAARAGVRALAGLQRALVARAAKACSELREAQARIDEMQPQLLEARELSRRALHFDELLPAATRVVKAFGAQGLPPEPSEDGMLWDAMSVKSALVALPQRVKALLETEAQAQATAAEAAKATSRLEALSAENEQLRQQRQQERSAVRSDVLKVLGDAERARKEAEERVAASERNAELKISAAGRDFKENYRKAVSRIAEAESLCGRLERRNRELKDELAGKSEAAEAAGRLEAELAQLQESNTGLRRALWDGGKKLLAMHRERRRLLGEVQSARRQAAPVRERIARHASRLKVVRAQRARVASALRALRREKAEADARIALAKKNFLAGKRRLEKLGAQAVAASEAAATAEGKARRLEELLGKSEDRRIAADCERRRLSEALVAKRKEAEQAQKEAAACREKAMLLESELEEAQRRAWRMESADRKHAGELWEQLEAAESSLRDSQAAASRLLREAEASRAAEKRLQESVAELGHELQSRSDALTGAEQRSQTAEQQLREAEERLERHQREDSLREQGRQQLQSQLDALLHRGGLAPPGHRQSLAEWIKEAPECTLECVMDRFGMMQTQIRELMSAKLDREAEFARASRTKPPRGDGGAGHDADEELARLREEVSAKAERISELQAGLRSLSDAKGELQEQLDRIAGSDEDSLRRALASAVAARVQAEEELRPAREGLARERAASEESSWRLREAEARAARLEEDNRRFRGEAEERSSSVLEALRKIDKLQSVLTKLEKTAAASTYSDASLAKAASFFEELLQISSRFEELCLDYNTPKYRLGQKEYSPQHNPQQFEKISKSDCEVSCLANAAENETPKSDGFPSVENFNPSSSDCKVPGNEPITKYRFEASKAAIRCTVFRDPPRSLPVITASRNSDNKPAVAVTESSITDKDGSSDGTQVSYYDTVRTRGKKEGEVTVPTGFPLGLTRIESGQETGSEGANGTLLESLSLPLQSGIDGGSLPRASRLNFDDYNLTSNTDFCYGRATVASLPDACCRDVCFNSLSNGTGDTSLEKAVAPPFKSTGAEGNSGHDRLDRAHVQHPAASARPGSAPRAHPQAGEEVTNKQKPSEERNSAEPHGGFGPTTIGAARSSASANSGDASVIAGNLEGSDDFGSSMQSSDSRAFWSSFFLGSGTRREI